MKVDQAEREEVTVYLPDTRGTVISRWGKGNTKLGPDVYTYSRLPGRPYPDDGPPLVDCSEERWLPVTEFPNHYEVSNWGHVRRKAGSPRSVEARVISPSVDDLGYCRAKLWIENKEYTRSVHTLVGRAFLQGPWVEQNEVNHLDGNPTNNRADNLRWATTSEQRHHQNGSYAGGTCPGSSVECEAVCYAKRVLDTPHVWDMWTQNSQTEDVPDELPPGARFIRIHVSGDFSSPNYINQWTALVRQNPDVLFWAYTRSWRVAYLLPDLEELRALPNMQLFASMDKSIIEWPPMGWRRAWIEDDPRCTWKARGEHNFMTEDAKNTYICPEETGRQPHCQACGYCLRGQKGDVTFLLH